MSHMANILDIFLDYYATCELYCRLHFFVLKYNIHYFNQEGDTMPRTSSKTLTDFSVPVDAIEEEFNRIMRTKAQLGDLRYIFKIALNNMSLFPNINLVEGATYKDYIERWIHGYNEALINLPSSRTASPKSSCSDPAIKTIVQYVTKVNGDEAKKQSNYHNLFMSAENIQGNLLEEYIAKVVRPYGWLWCNGNVLRAVDFCTVDGSALLQIKNKSNTENSSSSAIRTGTTIQKWYRLGTKTRKGVPLPDYKWESLNAIINDHVSGHAADCNMTEESYNAFLRNVATRNPRIITYR